MKKLDNYIIEKLKIGKNAVKPSKPLISIDLQNNDLIKIQTIKWIVTRSSYDSDLKQMRNYMNNNTDPETIANRTKDPEHLIRRLYVAVVLEWNDAILILGNKLNTLNIPDYSLEMFHKFIFYELHRIKKTSILYESFNNYIELYNIEMEE